MTEETNKEEHNWKPVYGRGGVADINKLKNVIKFILQSLPKDTTKYKTELIKLCFIVDYEYSKKYNKQNPTSVKYVRYNYGPFSDCFIEAFEQLVKEGVVVEVGLPFGIGYSLLSKDEPALDEDVKTFIKEIVSQYKNCSLKKMKEYIYSRPEFLSTEFGHDIVLINNV
jgi:hypothetical protein